MGDCRFLGTCVFFNNRMVQMPPAARILKQKYCRDDNVHCARYLVSVTAGRGSLPGDLLPNQVETARRIIEEWAAVPVTQGRMSPVHR
jgi:hypothetical protein